jgi:hypothetical protein
VKFHNDLRWPRDEKVAQSGRRCPPSPPCWREPEASGKEVGKISIRLPPLLRPKADAPGRSRPFGSGGPAGVPGAQIVVDGKRPAPPSGRSVRGFGCPHGHAQQSRTATGCDGTEASASGEVERGESDLAHRLARAGNAEPGVVRHLERLGGRAARVRRLRPVQWSGGRPPGEADVTRFIGFGPEPYCRISASGPGRSRTSGPGGPAEHPGADRAAELAEPHPDD